MSASLLMLVVPAVLAAVAVVMIVSSRRSHDGVDSFRRQIDALSPEARRPVIDQVQNAAGRPANDEHGDDEHGDGEHGDDEPPDDKDGARGA